jgi:hypothetical protein
MRCPHCSVGVNVEWDETYAYVDDSENPQRGVEIAHGECPECEGLIVKLQYGRVSIDHKGRYNVTQIEKEEPIYPRSTARPVETEVPEPYKGEFQEACAVLNISPKASAALSRRVLQNILRQEFNIQRSSLAQEIDDFIHLSGVPSHLSGAIDAVRNIGNFAAHPLKDSNTGAIVDVEAGESEWLLDVLEALFDFTFVQPKRLEERKKKLNEKLDALGKPPMKE